MVEAVRVVRRDRGDATWLAADQLDFSYRMSAFKGRWRDRFVITAVRSVTATPDPPVTGKRCALWARASTTRR